MKKSEALVKVKRIRELIDSFGGPYAADHNEFKSLVFALRGGPLQDPYFREKLSDLERQANTGFSVRKFENRTGGLQQVKVWALGSLNTAESLIEQHWPS
jgi:hypothetical protein